MTKVNRPRNPVKGNILALVVLILGVIFVLAVYFGSATVERTRQTQRSLGGDQASSLAEAAVVRAVHIMSQEMNNPKSFEKGANKGRFAVMLRYPLPVSTKAQNTDASELGADDALDVSVMDAEGFPSKCELTLADLRLKPAGEDWLDELVKFATGDKAQDFEITVNVELEKAFRVNSKPLPSGDYQVPGIDMEFSTRPDVRKFLNNEGKLNWVIEFPDWLQLFDFTIPIQVHIPIIDQTITLATIDPAPIIDLAVQPLTKGTELADAMNCPDGVGIKDYVTLDKILRAIFHHFLNKPNLYPVKLFFDENFFTKPEDLWPEGVKVPEDHSRYVEKYGTLKISSKAIINFKDGTSSERRVEACKEFKVSDVEPMAPLYSFFCANTTNDRINFNDHGGQFYVNNSAKRILSKEERETLKELQGQIRINYKPDDYVDEEQTGTPLVINTSLMGHFDGPRLTENNFGNGAFNLAAGTDALLMLGRTKSMVISQAQYSIDGTVYSKNVNTKKGSPLPKELKFSRGPIRHGFGLTSDISDKHAKFLHRDPQYMQERKKYYESGLKKRNDSYRWWTEDPHKMAHEDFLKKKAESINFLPDPTRFSTNIIAFGISMAMRAFGSSLTDLTSGAVIFGSDPPQDSFSRMMMPWMGTKNSYYCIPTLGWGQNKTHFFGINTWYPTLSRDIEGMVAKRYRQWHVTIIGLFAKDRLPLLPFPPPWCFVPPIPVPFWFADQIVNKYDYNMWFMKAYDVENDTTDDSMSIYDPDYMINMPANYYSLEQFAKKSNYYYRTMDDFVTDLPNRMITIDGKQALQLNGITFIAGSLGADNQPFKPAEGDTFYVTGKGSLVCSGNISLGCNVKCVDEPENRTIFSLIARNGGLIMTDEGEFVIEGSIYTNRGIYLGANTKLNIQGNWVTNEFAKQRMRGEVMIDYVASRVRSSLGSLHPIYGKYEPRRYHMALAPRWSAWKVD